MVGLLPLRLLRIVRPGLYQGREIADSIDLILREQQPTKLAEVQPLIRRFPNSAVVQIEAVDINVDSHLPLEKQKPPEGGFAPGRRSNRGGGVY